MDAHEDKEVLEVMRAPLSVQRERLAQWGYGDVGLLMLMSACDGGCFFCASDDVVNPPDRLITDSPFDRRRTKEWTKLRDPSEATDTEQLLKALSKPKGKPFGPDHIAQYVDDDTCFVSGFRRLMLLASTRKAPVTVDDLALGAEVLGVNVRKYTFRETELGMDLRAVLRKALPDLSDEEVLSPHDETISLVVKDQIPLKAQIVENFQKAGGRMLDFTPGTPLPVGYEAGNEGAPPGEYQKISLSLNGKAAYTALHTHDGDLPRACKQLSRAGAKKVWTKLDDMALRHMCTWVYVHGSDAKWGIVSSRELRHGLVRPETHTDSSHAGDPMTHLGESCMATFLKGELGVTNCNCSVRHFQQKTVVLSSCTAELAGAVEGTKDHVRVAETLEACNGGSCRSEVMKLDASSCIKNVLQGLSEVNAWLPRHANIHASWISEYWRPVTRTLLWSD